MRRESFKKYLKDKFPEIDTDLFIAIFEEQFNKIKVGALGNLDWISRLNYDLNVTLCASILQLYNKQSNPPVSFSEKIDFTEGFI